MAHRILTCKNHPNLRWSTKEQAVYKGHYTGARNIMYNGSLPYTVYSDKSGIHCEGTEAECFCRASDLILAPEDKMLFPSMPEYNPESEEYISGL